MKTGRMNESTLSGRMLHVLALLAIMAMLCGTAHSEVFIKKTPLDGHINNEKFTTDGNRIAMKPSVADDLERSMNDDLENKQPVDEKHTVAGRRSKNFLGSGMGRAFKGFGRHGFGQLMRRGRRIPGMIRDILTGPMDTYKLSTQGTGFMNTPFVADDLQRSEDGFTENVHQNDEKHAVAGARTGVKPRHAPHAIGAGVRPNTAAKHVAIYADKNDDKDLLKFTLHKFKDVILKSFGKAVDKAFSYINSL